MKKLQFDECKKNVISQALKRERNSKHLTQGDMAAKMQTLGVNIDQQMISKIERNQRIVTDYELACFCIALGITPERLLADFYKEYPKEK